MELIRLEKQLKLLKKAYATIDDILSINNNLSLLERDGIIQRFEYNIELSWKTLKKFLEYYKLDFTPSPRDIIRESFKLGIIDNLEIWEEFLDIRNQMSHIYSEYYSEDNYEFIIEHYKKIGDLIIILEKKLK